MDDEKLNKFIASTNEQIVIFGGHIASLRASVTVLKFAADSWEDDQCS